MSLSQLVFDTIKTRYSIDESLLNLPYTPILKDYFVLMKDLTRTEGLECGYGIYKTDYYRFLQGSQYSSCLRKLCNDLLLDTSFIDKYFLEIEIECLRSDNKRLNQEINDKVQSLLKESLPKYIEREIKTLSNKYDELEHRYNIKCIDYITLDEENNRLLQQIDDLEIKLKHMKSDNKRLRSTRYTDYI